METVLVNFAIFCIGSACLTYMAAAILTNILVRDMIINRHLTRFLDKESRQNFLNLFLIPVFNILLVIAMAYMVYS